MDRRLFLKSLGLAAGALGPGSLLVACGGEPAASRAGPAGIPAGQPELSVITGSYETLAGRQRLLTFGIRTLDNVELRGADVDVYLRDPDGAVLGGPFPATYTEAAAGLPLYVTRVDLPRAGQLLLVAVHGDEYGEAALNVVTAETSAVRAPGQPAVVVRTPTTADPMGLDELCTQDPPCGMHEVSLDAALGQGRPVALMFATPAYCQTAVCGPSVATLDEVRASRDWGPVAFIHVEIYADAGSTVSEPVQSWNLPSEPWLFTIGGDGTIVGRLDGPMVPDAVSALVEQLLA